MEQGKQIRDFIYLDVERLYSVYSQVFEGVADQIVQSYAAALSTESAQKGALLSGASAESSTIEVSRRTENRFLYDHMYTLLEKRLEPAIIDSSKISSSNLTSLRSGVYLRATGPVIVADFERMKALFEKFNRLAEAIAYSSRFSELQAAMATAQESIQGIQDRNQKAQAKVRLEQLRDPKRLAKELGLSQDEQLLKNLTFIADMFYPDGFDVTVMTTQAQLSYRAVADRRWLRITPPLLRAQYGGSSAGPWTVVGQVTHVPGIAPRLDTIIAAAPVAEAPDPEPSMRDPFMSMFASALGLERMFLESKSRTEIVLSPLAIYREVTLESAVTNTPPGA